MRQLQITDGHAIGKDGQPIAPFARFVAAVRDGAPAHDAQAEKVSHVIASGHKLTLPLEIADHEPARPHIAIYRTSFHVKRAFLVGYYVEAIHADGIRRWQCGFFIRSITAGRVREALERNYRDGVDDGFAQR